MIGSKAYLKRHRQHDGKPCPYCERPMSVDHVDICPTRDHHPVPRSKGGTRTLVCCRVCNMVKADRTAAEWEEFMADNPGWWLDGARKQRRAEARKRQKRARGLRQPERPSTPMADPLRSLLKKTDEGSIEC